MRYGLRERQVLDALEAAGCERRIDLREWSAWIARCPVCRRRDALSVRLRKDFDELLDFEPDDASWRPVRVACRNGCSVGDLFTFLSVKPDLLAAREEARTWRVRYERMVDFTRRLVAA